jgi:soluble lytic murein transglycosylase-like protein
MKINKLQIVIVIFIFSVIVFSLLTNTYNNRLTQNVNNNYITKLSDNENNENNDNNLAKYISKEFEISIKLAIEIIKSAELEGEKNGIDKYLILAVIAVESRFHPYLESKAGALGLMQIMPNIHKAKIEKQGNIYSVFEVKSNISIGTEILKEFIKMTGNIESGLAKYVGAGNDINHVYVQDVLSWHDKLKKTAQLKV